MKLLKQITPYIIGFTAAYVMVEVSKLMALGFVVGSIYTYILYGYFPKRETPPRTLSINDIDRMSPRQIEQWKANNKKEK